MLRHVPSIPTFLRGFSLDEWWILSKAILHLLKWRLGFSLSVSIVITLCFCFHFAYVEPSLKPSNESSLRVVFDPFCVLLNLVCSYLVEDFCTYVRQRYWPVIFLFCSVFAWFLCQDDEWLHGMHLGVFPVQLITWKSFRRIDRRHNPLCAR